VSTLTQVNIANLALSRIGAKAITTMADNTPTALAVNTWWTQAVSIVARSAPWNCLMKRMMVDPVAGYPPAVVDNVVPEYLYEWSAEYQLPADYVRLVELNGNDVWDADGTFNGDQYEIYGQARLNPAPPASSSAPALYGPALFANPDPDPTTGDPPQADMKYVCYTDDTTVYDSLFIDSLICILGARVATGLRKDDAQMALALENEFTKVLLPKAIRVNLNEGKPVRYDLASESRFVASRWGSTNG
jgi:hypothetical protein